MFPTSVFSIVFILILNLLVYPAFGTNEIISLIVLCMFWMKLPYMDEMFLKMNWVRNGKIDHSFYKFCFKILIWFFYVED